MMFRRTISLLATLAVVASLLLATSSAAGPFFDVGAQSGVAPHAFSTTGSVYFRVRIENLTGDTALPAPFSPGVWVVHQNPNPLFTAGQPDAGLGLERLAEDGNPTNLAASVMGQPGVLASGVYNTPVGSVSPGLLLPGQAYEFEFSTDDPLARLSFASMYAQSNDIFVAPSGEGIPLFQLDGLLEAGTRDITNLLRFWDAGTEVNEAPGMGPNQAPRQPAPNTGPAEGVVSLFTNSTRAMPLATGIVAVEVIQAGGTYTFTVRNESAMRGAMVTPVGPIFYVVHDNTWQFFTEGQPAGNAGLEDLAEYGSPAQLVASYTGAAGTLTVGAQAVVVGGMSAGPAAPGQMFRFSATPQGQYRFLSIGSMVGDSNDAFMALPPGGVALLDAFGLPRSPAAIVADIERMLTIWDAGTEANEVSGVGPNQAPRQPAPNTGPADPINMVRRYADSTNDLAGPYLGGFVNIEIAPSAMMTSTFWVTVTNTSTSTVYPGNIAPMLWATHDASVSLFTPGMHASVGLERLAEDGNPSTLAAAVSGMAGVGSSGTTTGGPLAPGDSTTFSVTVDMAHPFLSVAAMVVPSNDTFMAFGPEGVRLLTEAGQPRTMEEIAVDIAASLRAWDAGTERNQASAAGPDQAPRQAGPNTGADEGSGLVRLLDDPVWRYPRLSDALHVTITPEQRLFFPLLGK